MNLIPQQLSYKQSSFLTDRTNLKQQTSNGLDQYKLDEADEDNFSEKDIKFDKQLKNPMLLSQFSKNSYMTKTFDQVETEEEAPQTTRHAPRIFSQAKFIMKPLGQFLEEKNSQQMQISQQQQPGLSQNLMKNGLLGLNSKDKTIPAKGNHLQFGYGKANQTARDNTTQSKTKLTNESTSISNKGIKSISSVKCDSSSFLNQKNSQSQSPDSSTEEENQKKKNIFTDNIDLKRNHVSPLFDTGPRYDKNNELIKYSIVGKSDWYKKVDQQKNGGKLTHMNMKLALQNNRRQSTLSANKQTPMHSNNFDMKSVLSKQRRSNRVVGEGSNGESQNKQQTVTKDHLLMKFTEIEKRIAKNEEKEQEQLKSTHFQDKLDSTRQTRCIENFDVQKGNWCSTAQLLISKQDQTQNFLGKGPLAQQSHSKYKNYIRLNPNDTLLMRSEDIYRCKREQGEYLEHLKDPFEYIGQKNLWESMLRNDAIDITTKYSQKKKLDDFFFPSQISSNQKSQKQSVSFQNLDDVKGTLNDINYITSENGRILKTEETNNTLEQINTANNLAMSTRNESFKQLSQGGSKQKINYGEGYSINQKPQISPLQKSILKQQFHSKVDLTFKKSDYKVRELSYTNGVRIQTSLNHDNLEVIRTPKKNYDPTSQFMNSTTFKNSSTTKFSDGQLNTTRGLAKTLNASSYFLEREKEQTSKYGSMMKKPYLDYFTSSDIDCMAIQGENKLHSEKLQLINDGKQRFETYLLANQNIIEKNEYQNIEKNVQKTAPISRTHSSHTSQNQMGSSFIKQSNLSRIMQQQNTSNVQSSQQNLTQDKHQQPLQKQQIVSLLGSNQKEMKKSQSGFNMKS